MNDTVRLLAFYLPQFHPIPENDLWWGKGFTEWTNTAKARPLFPGHRQPHLPADLGFYDLRVPEVRRDQAALARRYGIDGFCYHYYWFSGRRILERPLEDMLADPESTMPFCLCWANENWTRRWDGAEQDVLLAQKYLPDDDLAFIEGLVRFFKDPRYIRVDGAPLLIVYRPQEMPDPKKSVAIWRAHCRAAGIEHIHVCAALTFGNTDYAQFGFDSGVEFPPHQSAVRNLCPDLSLPFFGAMLEYRDLARSYLDRRYPGPKVFKTVLPSWDNSARVGERATIVLDATPENYQCWLGAAIDHTKKMLSGDERLVFINAWNEWAEGCHLEPDLDYGHAFLAATLNAKTDPKPCGDFQRAEAARLIAAAPRRRRRWPRLAVRLAKLITLHPDARRAIATRIFSRVKPK